MDDHDYHLMVPRRLDDPPKFLFWDFDVAIVWIGVVFMGIAGNFFITSLILAFAASSWCRKLNPVSKKAMAYTCCTGIFRSSSSNAHPHRASVISLARKSHGNRQVIPAV